MQRYACTGQFHGRSLSMELSSWLRAQRLESRTNFIHEELRLLPGGKVAALGEIVEVDELGERTFCPASRGWVQHTDEQTRCSNAGSVELTRSCRNPLN